MSKKTKVITDEDEVFYFEKIEASISQTILKKLNKVRVQAHKKIPGLVIWDRDKKCKILVRFYDSKTEKTINNLRPCQVIEFALEHFLTCRKGKV
jgi:hypothetical protein